VATSNTNEDGQPEFEDIEITCSIAENPEGEEDIPLDLAHDPIPELYGQLTSLCAVVSLMCSIRGLVTYWWHHYVQNELHPINGNDAAINTANKHRRAWHRIGV
jgi:hypothetical protein